MNPAVLFVCLGNICRSPTAHAVFRHKVAAAGLQDRITIDSAGTGDWHLGEPPDRRASAAALERGYDMRDLRARQVRPADFGRFDLVLAMDRQNLRDLQAMCPPGYDGELALFLRYREAPRPIDVPDPYYGGADGFAQVLDLVEEAADGLLAELQRRFGEP